MGLDTLNWEEWENKAGAVKAMIAALPDGIETQQAMIKFAELCYWFSEAHIAATEPPVKE